MSDDEVIRFEITDHDLESEFNPFQSRRKNKKEQQIYGMWAKDSDEEDNEDTVRQRVRKPKDYSAPIGFIAGGVQQAGKKKEKAETKELDTAEPTTSQGLSQLPDSSDDEEESAPHESETAGIRRAGQGMRTMNLGGNVGTWEKHTKGIGAKLLLQMGYQPGKGLGKSLQGISAPVEAAVRKGRGAIGAYGPEKAAQKVKKEEEKRLKEKEDLEKDVKEKTGNWKKSHAGRYFYRDASDVIQEGKPVTHTVASNSLSRVPVIDLTGREKRVLAGYHALRAAAPRFEHEPRRECSNFSCPELTHNLELLVDCCEQDIILNARELHTAEDEIVVLERDLNECKTKMQEHNDVISKVQGVLDRVERLNRPDVSLEMAYEVLNDLKQTYPLEYQMFGLGAVGANIISPLISALMAKWDPLADPEEPIPVFLKWRELLTPESYNTLLWQHFAPKYDQAAEAWNPRSPTPMLRLTSAWEVACPPFLVRQCASRAVCARLLGAVRAWDPTGDTQPLHQWVLPWHDIAGEALAASVYPLIRSRLGAALTAWHPADGSARPLLGAWRAWGPALTALLHQHIVPKLRHCLQTSAVDLVGGENAAWQWCVSWTDLLGAPTMASLASSALLPRWLAALAAWLNTQPPRDQIVRSYTEFKKTFPEDVLREPGVRDAFRKALDMMNRSADVDFTPEPPPPPRISLADPKDSTRLADVIASSNQQKSFSELLESKCSEKGITYVPLPGKYREGRPLYRIGSEMQCYVIRNVIMYTNDGGKSYMPISMDRILKMAED